MSTLQKLRGETITQVPILGRTLTLYRQGACLGLFLLFATLVLFNLPWRWIPGVGEILPLLIAAIGCYLSAALMSSLTPVGMDEHTASRRWL